jgi:hypothetical protein
MSFLLFAFMVLCISGEFDKMFDEIGRWFDEH